MGKNSKIIGIFDITKTNSYETELHQIHFIACNAINLFNGICTGAGYNQRHN